MAATPPCLDLEEMQRFLVGTVSEPELERIERHLGQCPACLRAMRTVHPEDTLAEALRGQAEAPAEDGDEQVEAMIRRLEALQLPATETPSEAAMPSWPAGRPSSAEEAAAPAMADLYPFLGPAQEPGELGRLGPYRVLGVLGAGGMGVVFRAEEVDLGRLVALKVLLPALAGHPNARKRFLREARAAASVEHDHVVHINRVGEDRGVPYVAMPLLQGESLDSRLARQGRLPVAEVLRIGREVAEGLDAAHAKGLIHRDVKPANVWLQAPYGHVKLLDFGLARSAEGGAEVTGTGFVVGTPAYMAPEQARGESVDRRADLFSLGCLLYRMAAGRPPFPGATAIQVLYALALQEPVPPHRLNPEVPPGLSDLILRLLAKDPGGRPASAREVIDALSALDHNRPGPPGGQEAAGPAARGAGRTRGTPLARKLAFVGMLTALAVAAAVFGPGLLRRLTRRESSAAPPLGEGPPVRPVRPSLPMTLRGAGTRIRGLAFSPDGRLLAVAGDARAQLWDVTTGQEAVAFEQARGAFLSVAFSPDGKHVAFGGFTSVTVWDAASGRKQLGWPMPGEVDALTYSPDGRHLAGVDTVWPGRSPYSSHLNVWERADGRECFAVTSPKGQLFRFLAYSPDGTRLVASLATWDGAAENCPSMEIQTWDPATWEKLPPLARQEAPASELAYSPDGTRLAAGSRDGTVTVWDARTGQVALALPRATSGTYAVAFSPDGRRLAGADRKIVVWDAQTGRKFFTLQGHTRGILCLAFSPDGKLLASGGADGLVKVWDATSRPSSGP